MMKMFCASVLLAAAAFLAPLPVAEHAVPAGTPKPGEAQAAMMPANLAAPEIVREGGLDESAGLTQRGPEPTTAWMVAAAIFGLIVLRRTSAAT